MSKTVLKFEPNKPVEVALAFPQGKITPSNFGADQVMFTLEYPPEHITFLDLHAAGSLKVLDPIRGERFMICKRKGAERNSPVKWDVWLTPESEKARAAREAGIPMAADGRPEWGTSAPASSPKPPATQPDAPTLLERQLAESLAAVERLKAAKAEADRLKAEAAAKPTPIALAARPVTKLEDALKTAVAAAFAATEYAKSIGYAGMPAFSAEDISKLAMTSLIESGGRR